jgi:hypothetical protein
MPIPATTPPASPLTIYCTSNAATGLWSAKTSTGATVSTESKNVANDLIAYCTTNLIPDSTMLNILSPSGNPIPAGSVQLFDLKAQALPAH